VVGEEKMTKRAEIYLKPSWTSCRKAVAHLEGKGIELVKHDLAKEPPSRELLERLIDESHLEDFINQRSPAFKERNLDVSKLTKKRAIDLMMEEPNLIRRPLLLSGKQTVFGYDADAYDSL
jgi:Spx/MgsR family transcriptional regulator